MCEIINIKLVGQSIKNLRVKNRWSQEHLGSLIGYSTRNIRRIENDGTSSIVVINLFAEAFNVSAFDILNGCFYFIFIYC